MSYPEQLLLGQLLASPPHGSEEESVAVVAVVLLAIGFGAEELAYELLCRY